MSMDLYVWKSPVVTDPDEAQRLLELDDESVFDASDDVARFCAELFDRLPPHSAFTEDELRAGATPWADSPVASDRLVWLSLRWSAEDEDVETIVELARSHDLVLYDPQGPSFHSPAADDEPSPPGVGEFARGAALVVVGVLLALGAWKLSIPVLSWVFVFVGAFVVLVALLSLAAVAQEAWRARRSP